MSNKIELLVFKLNSGKLTRKTYGLVKTNLFG